MITTSNIIISFTILLAINTLIKLWLIWLNTGYIKKNINVVPQEFTQNINLEAHQKAGLYTLTRSYFGTVKLLFNLALLCFWIYGGGLNFLNNFIGNFQIPPIWQGIVFFLTYGLIGTILAIPFDLYSNFVIEEKFGFNKMTAKIYILDFIKQSILSLILGVPLLYGILYFVYQFENLWWFYSWIFLVIFQLIIMWAYPKFIAPWFNKFSPLEDQNLAQEIKELCQRCEVKFKEYFVMNASIRSAHGNAYFTGFGKNKRIVFFDTLLKSLEPSEVIAVLAHELGHFKRKHILKSLIIAIFSMLIGFAILGALYKLSAFYLAFNIENPNAHIALMLFMLISPIYTFLFTPLASWFSRKNEFEADEFAATFASSKKLISALIKMYKDNSSTLTPHPLYSKFYFSHPPAKERVEFLNQFSS